MGQPERRLDRPADPTGRRRGAGRAADRGGTAGSGALGQRIMARVCGFDEELRFFDDAIRLIPRVFWRRRIVTAEQVLGEFISGITIAKNAGCKSSSY